MVILIPATFINLYESFKSLKKSQRLKIPNKIHYEISQWIRSIEFIVYFLIYTFAIEIFGYLISTMIFANFLTFRLATGLRSGYLQVQYVLL